MAKAKGKADSKKAAAAEKETKKTGKAGKGKEDDKAAKRAARMEALKNRPEGQRCNSKQVDIIELEGGGKVISYGYAIRKTGTLVTTVTLDAKGNVVSSSTVLVPNTKVKCKKGHGNIVPGVAGEGKKKKADPDVDDEDDDEDDED